MSESGLAETLADHIASLDAAVGRGADRGERTPGPPPSPSWPAGSRGSRCGSRCGPTTSGAAPALLDAEEAEIRRILGRGRRRRGVRVDDEAIEDAVAARSLAATG